MDLQLQGRRALVTGGARGIGKAVAAALAREGVDVALLSRGAPALVAAAAELAAQTGRRVVATPGDTTDDASVRTAVAQAQALLGGPIDILVNAAAEPAGLAAPPTLQDITAQAFHGQLDTKVMGYLRCAREVAPAMQAAGWGRIVNISGLNARQAGNTLGSIRNVAVAALTKNLADELGRHGINVTVVHPGLTVTERTAERIAREAAASGESEAAVAQRLGAVNATRRLVTAEEVADVVVFLCSPRSRAINGDAIAAGGGALGTIHY